jgi:hypothetical protein
MIMSIAEVGYEGLWINWFDWITPSRTSSRTALM